MKMVLRDFVYLDWEKIRSLAAQLLHGVPENVTTESGKDVSGGGNIEGSLLGLLKGSAESDYRYFRNQNETRSFHHHVYSLVEEHLKQENLITLIDNEYDLQNWQPQSFHDGQIIRIKGIVRLMDYQWAMDMFEATPTMMETIIFLTRLGIQQQSSDVSRQTLIENEKALKDIKAMKPSKVADLVRRLYGDTIRIKILPDRAHSEKIFVGSGNKENFYDSAASLSQKYGYEVDANWITLAQVNLTNPATELELLPTGNQLEDAVESSVLAISSLAHIAGSVIFPAISITPISIYRISS